MIERIARRMILALATVATAAFVVLAIGAAAGRWSVAVAPQTGAGASMREDELIFVVPVPASALRTGDEVVVTLERGADPTIVVVDSVVDAGSRKIAFTDQADDRQELVFPPKVWRVRTAVPMFGPIYRALVGVAQGAIFLLAGATLLIWAERARREQHAPAAVAT